MTKQKEKEGGESNDRIQTERPPLKVSFYNKEEEASLLRGFHRERSHSEEAPLKVESGRSRLLLHHRNPGQELGRNWASPHVQNAGLQLQELHQYPTENGKESHSSTEYDSLFKTSIQITKILQTSTEKKLTYEGKFSVTLLQNIKCIQRAQKENAQLQIFPPAKPLS